MTHKKKLLPTVSVEEFLAIDPKNPETQTSSAIVNAVADAFQSVRPVTGEMIAAHLDVDQRKLSHALELITGHSLSALRSFWLERRYEAITAAHPDWSRDRIARALGLADHSTLHRFLSGQNLKERRSNNAGEGK